MSSIKSYLRNLLEALVKNKRATISSYSSPSASNTVEFSGNYTTTADGYVLVKCNTGAGGEDNWLSIHDSSYAYGVNILGSSIAGMGFSATLRVSKGHRIVIGAGANTVIEKQIFIYSQGSAP